MDIIATDVHRAWHLVYGDEVTSLDDMENEEIAHQAELRSHGSYEARLFHAITHTFEEPAPRQRCADCLFDYEPCTNHKGA